jgi:hypothetical protein
MKIWGVTFIPKFLPGHASACPSSYFPTKAIGCRKSVVIGKAFPRFVPPTDSPTAAAAHLHVKSGKPCLIKGMLELLKIVISALLIFAVAEISKRSSTFGAVVASLPLVSILAMIWLYHDTRDVAKVAGLSRDIFWLVLPSLTLFVLLPPLLLRWKFPFPLALGLACAATVAAYLLMIFVLRRIGVQL